jgi:hypothetical protein
LINHIFKFKIEKHYDVASNVSHKRAIFQFGRHKVDNSVDLSIVISKL